MRYTSIIFDLDCTLLDTLDDLTDSINFMLDMYHLPLRTTNQIRDDVGNGIYCLVKRSLPSGTTDEQTDTALQIFKKHYYKNCLNKTKLYPGIMEVLDVLMNNNIKMAVVSNKADTAVRTLCDLFFCCHIPVALGETHGILKKPAPDLVLLALERLKSTKEESLYIGDSEVDIETARNAGMKCICVSWGFRDIHVLRDYGAETIIDKPNKILDFVVHNNEK